MPTKSTTPKSVEIEAELMSLSDTIASTYLTHNERADGGWETLRMIYDIRQTTTCSYDSPVGACASRAAPDADRPARPARAGVVPADRAGAGAWREGRDFFGNALTWIEIEDAHRRR